MLQIRSQLVCECLVCGLNCFSQIVWLPPSKWKAYRKWVTHGSTDLTILLTLNLTSMLPYIKYRQILRFYLCLLTKTRGVPNSGFRLFGRIQIVLWTIRPNDNMSTNSVVGWAFWHCTSCSHIYHLLMSPANYGHACMLSSHDPLPFIGLP